MLKKYWHSILKIRESVHGEYSFHVVLLINEALTYSTPVFSLPLNPVGNCGHIVD